MDNFNIPTNIYIDLSNAFDTLNFGILLNKLDYYGVKGCANRLICSFLSDRWQFADFSGHKSSYLPIKTGVAQGSVLGPLLFLIYINDLPLVSNVFDMLKYADDTTLYCNINQDIHVGEEVINAELSKIWEWLCANKLSLNIAKTRYMVFHTSNRNVIYPNLKVNNSNIEMVTQVNFLGVILYSHMTWNKHINHISVKIARSIGISLVSSQKCLPRICLNYYIQYFNPSSFPLLSLTVGVCCERKPFSASAPKESSQNNYQ